MTRLGFSFLASLLASLLLIGCAAQAGTPESAATPTPPAPTATHPPPTPTSTATLMPGQYLADFSAPGAWRLGETSNGEISLEEDVGRIRLVALDGNTDTWLGERFGDGTYEVTASQREGPLNDPFGMYFMVDEDFGSFYQFTINSRGGVSIGHYSGGPRGVWTSLVNDDWFYSEAVHPYLKSTNTLRVEAQGGQLSFYINDVRVGTALDFRGREGDVGLLVIAGPDNSVAVEFDDFSYIPTMEHTVSEEAFSTGDRPLTIVPHWQSGETRSLEIIKSRSAGTPGSTTSGKTPVELTVLEATKGGYALRWDIGELETGDALEDPAAAALMKLAASIDPVYEVNADGVYLGLNNWQEIQAGASQSIELLLDELAKQGLSGQERQAVRDMVEPMLSSRENLETFLLPELMNYHHIFGTEFDAENPLQYESLLPNPYGGKPFAAIVRFDAPRIRKDLGLVELTWSQILDPESTRATLLKTMSDMSEAIGADSVTEEDLPDPFSIEDTGRLIVDINTGWIMYLELTRKITIGSDTRFDRVQIIDVTDTASEGE